MSMLEIILVVIALQLVVLAFLLIATVITHTRKSGAKIRRLRRTWFRLLPAALQGRREATERMQRTLHSRASFQAFHVFLDEQLRYQRGGSPLRLRRLSRAIGFTDRLQHQMLESRDQLGRAAAAKTLGRLRERIARESATELLQSNDPAVVLAAAYASASFRDPRHFLPVFRAIYQRTPITLHGAAELLSGFEEGVCPVIHKLLINLVGQYRHGGTPHPIDPQKEVDRSDTAAQVVMIDLLAFYAYVPAALTLLRLLELSEDEEVLIHLVKALAKVGDTTAVPRLTRLLGHQNWVIRSQAAQALATLEAGEAVPAIHALLGDDNIRVRIYAQQALRSLKTVEQPVEVFA
jgi:hypothetical protein